MRDMAGLSRLLKAHPSAALDIVGCIVKERISGTHKLEKLRQYAQSARGCQPIP